MIVFLSFKKEPVVAFLKIHLEEEDHVLEIVGLYLILFDYNILLSGGFKFYSFFCYIPKNR